jgi:Sulfatase
VIYTTDNGAETFTWPDGGTTPFRGEKNTNWEGSYRVPALVRWPGLVAPHSEINQIFSAEDWVQTLMAAAGEPEIAGKLLAGYSTGGKSFKVHLDGYDQRDVLAGRGPDKRREFFYWTDDGNFAGLRYDQYKAVFMEQPAHGLEVWMQPLVPLRAPKLFNLRSDPFERSEREGGRLRQMVRGARVRPCSDAGDRCAAPANVSGVSAAAKTRQLLNRPGHGKTDEPEEQQLAAAPRGAPESHRMLASSFGMQPPDAHSGRFAPCRGRVITGAAWRAQWAVRPADCQANDGGGSALSSVP